MFEINDKIYFYFGVSRACMIRLCYLNGSKITQLDLLIYHLFLLGILVSPSFLWRIWYSYLAINDMMALS